MHVSFFIGIFRSVAPCREIYSPDLEMKHRYFGISSYRQRLGAVRKKKKKKNVLLDMNRVVRNYIEEREGWLSTCFFVGKKISKRGKNARATCGKMRWIKGSCSQRRSFNRVKDAALLFRVLGRERSIDFR